MITSAGVFFLVVVMGVAVLSLQYYRILRLLKNGGDVLHVREFRSRAHLSEVEKLEGLGLSIRKSKTLGGWEITSLSTGKQIWIRDGKPFVFASVRNEWINRIPVLVIQDSVLYELRIHEGEGTPLLPRSREQRAV